MKFDAFVIAQSIILFNTVISVEFLIFEPSVELNNNNFAWLEIISTNIKIFPPHDNIGIDKSFESEYDFEEINISKLFIFNISKVDFVAEIIFVDV